MLVSGCVCIKEACVQLQQKVKCIGDRAMDVNLEAGYTGSNGLKLNNVLCLCAFLLLVIISGCTSSSDDNADANQAADVGPELIPLPSPSSYSPIALKTRLATPYSESELAGWACISAEGLAYVYSFYIEGAIPGLDGAPVGLELFLDPENLPTNLDGQIKFLWTQQSVDSILMESPNNGSSVSLNNIRFAETGEMSAYSSTRGQLYCSNDNGN